MQRPDMTRRLLLVFSLCATSGAAAERPNIVFVFSDDHAAHAISAYGSDLIDTPHLDRLAREGALFRHCFVGNSICAPSRATVLTGKHSHANGVIDNGSTFDGSQGTFPKMLRQSGYQTAIIGKWHLKSDPTGFDHWEVLRGQGPYYNPRMKTPGGERDHEGYTTEVITDLALDWLKNGRRDDAPFLLCYWHKAPHREWLPGPDQVDWFADRDLPEPNDLFDDGAGRGSAFGQQTMTIAEHLSRRDLKFQLAGNLTDGQRSVLEAAYGPRNRAFEEAGLTGDALVRWKYQRYIKDYLRSVAGVDAQLGRVLDYLDESGLADDTIVVYSSDQGFFLGDHGFYDKRWMYEESLRTPLLVRWPGVVDAGVEVDALAQNIDFAPTFLEMAGVTPRDDMHGESLVPLLRGDEPVDWRRSIYYHYYEFPGAHSVRRHFGIRTARYKLIRYYGIDEWELFDLHRDPHELRSVHGDDAYRHVLRELKKDLARIQRDAGDLEPERPREAIRRDFSVAAARSRIDARLLVERSSLEDDRPADVDPSWRPLVVGGFLSTTDRDGVLVAQGGDRHGYALYLRDGRLCFAVRVDGELHEVSTGHLLIDGSEVHVVGMLDERERLLLYVDGYRIASAPGAFLAARPSDGFALGHDPGSAVGAYGDGEHGSRLDGRLRDVRVYEGLIDDEEVVAWFEER